MFHVVIFGSRIYEKLCGFGRGEFNFLNAFQKIVHLWLNCFLQSLVLMAIVLPVYDLATQCPSRRASMRKHSTPRSAALPLSQSRPQARQRPMLSNDFVGEQIAGTGSLNASPSHGPQVRARPTPRPRGLVDKDSQNRANEVEVTTFCKI